MMYSEKKNIVEVVGLVKGEGIEKIVVWGGRGKIGMVERVVNIGEFRWYGVREEGSGGFFGLGVGVKGGRGGGMWWR